MKKTGLMALALIALLAASCSKNQAAEDLLTLVPDDADMVMMVNAVSVCENFGCTVKDGKIQDIKPIEDAFGGVLPLPSGGAGVLKGIELDNIVLFGKQADKEVILAVNITDADKFVGSLIDSGENYKRTKSGDYEVLSNGSDAIVVIYDGHGFLVNGTTDEEAIAAVEKVYADAKAAPLASWKKDFMAENRTFSTIYSSALIAQDMGLTGLGNMCNLFFGSPNALDGACVCTRATLEGNSLSIEAFLADKAGDEIEVELFNNDDIDTKLARYADNSMMLMSFLAMPEKVDWQKVLTETMGERVVNQANFDRACRILSSIEGTAMLAVGYDETAIANSGAPISFVLALQTTPAKAQALKADIESVIGMAPMRPDVQLRDGDKLLVVTNRAITDKGGCAATIGKTADLVALTTAYIGKDSPLLKMAGVSDDISLRVACTDERLNATIELGNEKDNALFLKTLVSIVKRLSAF